MATDSDFQELKIEEPRPQNGFSQTTDAIGKQRLKYPTDVLMKINKNVPNATKKWSDTQNDLLMNTFLRNATDELLKSNIHVSFDNLKFGDISKLCSATASLLQKNEHFMRLSTTKKISGHQVKERLRSLVARVKMQVTYEWVACVRVGCMRKSALQLRYSTLFIA
jgi:hypothetical protein